MSKPMLKLRADLNTRMGDRVERAQALYALRGEIRSLAPDQVQLIAQDAGELRDPLTFGALLIAIAPTVVPKLLDLIKDFMGRNKDVTIELSIRSEKGCWIKLKAPYTSSPEDVVAWIKAVQTTLDRGSQGEDEDKARGA